MKDDTPRGKLARLRIATTRDRPGVLDELLSRAGAQVLHAPLIRIVPPTDVSELRETLARASEYNWIVFTSSNALRMVMQIGLQPAGDAPAFACVGDSTAQEAAAAGWKVALTAGRQHVKGLIEAFSQLSNTSGRVLYPRSEIAPPTLKEGLQALGFMVDDPVAYRTLPDQSGMNLLKQSAVRLDAVAFASPSAVDNAWAALGESLNRLRLFSIGPSTSARLRAHGLPVAGEALEHTAGGLAEAITAGKQPNE